ncbi:divergent polysaccharide deacetylase family protein [Profundibacter sp.]
MGRGLLLGIGWGVLVAGLAGAALSLVSGNKNTAPTVEMAAGDAASGQKIVREAEVEADVSVAPTVAPTVGTAQAPPQGVQTQDEAADRVRVPNADNTDISTQVPAAPQVAHSDEQPDNADAVSIKAPDVMIPQAAGDDQGASENEAGGGAMVSTDAPVITGSNAAQQNAPQPETQPEIQTDSAAMTAPPMQDGPDAGGAPQTALQEGANTPDVQEAPTPDARQPVQPDSPQLDAKLSEVPAPPAMSQEAEAESKTGKPESNTTGQFDTARVPVPKMTNLAPNVKTNRLPTIGGTPEVAGAADGATTPKTDARALAAYAMAFENPDAKPLFSVVLIDDPQSPVSNDVLSHLPFALSFAIDAARDDAHSVAARYRAAGFEVLMLTNLPFGASATDIEVAFGAYSRAIPEAIGVLDLGANGFLRGPSTATQIAGIMSEHGYGLITPSKGLNSAQKAALREGVPAVLLFRELDVDGEKPSVIRRYLDRAAFRAAQEGSVIMLGHTRSETIEALVTWALEDRAANVAIAPVSAVMLAQ